MKKNAKFKGLEEIRYPSEDMVLRFGSKSKTGEIILEEATGKFKFDPELVIQAKFDLNTTYSSDTVTIDASEDLIDPGSDAVINGATATQAGILTSTWFTRLEDSYNLVGNVALLDASNTFTDYQTVTDGGSATVIKDGVITFREGMYEVDIQSHPMVGGWYNISSLGTNTGGSLRYLYDTGNLIAGDNVTITSYSPGKWQINADLTAGGTDLSNFPTTEVIELDSSTGIGTSLLAATTTHAGVLSALDKKKIDLSLLKTGDTMTGDLTIDKNYPSIVFAQTGKQPPLALSSWADGDDNSVFTLGTWVDDDIETSYIKVVEGCQTLEGTKYGTWRINGGVVFTDKNLTADAPVLLFMEDPDDYVISIDTGYYPELASDNKFEGVQTIENGSPLVLFKNTSATSSVALYTFASGGEPVFGIGRYTTDIEEDYIIANAGCPTLEGTSSQWEIDGDRIWTEYNLIAGDGINFTVVSPYQSKVDLDSSDLAKLSTANTFVNTQTVENGFPLVVLKNTSASSSVALYSTTSGNDPLFGIGRYDAGSIEEDYLLAYEGCSTLEGLGNGNWTIDGEIIWNAYNFDPSSKENSLGNPTTDGYVLSSDTAGARSWIAPTLIAANMPRGTVTMFDTAIGIIPAGWVKCDGTNGSPDLSSMTVTSPGHSVEYIIKLN